MGFTKHFNRRQFMKLGASLGVSAVGTHLLPRSAVAASRERVVIFQGVGWIRFIPTPTAAAASMASGYI